MLASTSRQPCHVLCEIPPPSSVYRIYVHIVGVARSLSMQCKYGMQKGVHP